MSAAPSVIVAAPRSCPCTSVGLIAKPTSPTVVSCSIVTRPVSSSTEATTPLDADLPERRQLVELARLADRADADDLAAGAEPLADHLAVASAARRRCDTPPSHRSISPPASSARELADLPARVLARGQQRAPDERRRAARAGRALVRRRRRCRTATIATRSNGSPSASARICGEHRAAALAELGRADRARGGAVGVDAHHRHRRRMRARVGRGDAEADAAAALAPAERLRQQLEVRGEVGVDAALAGQDLLARLDDVEQAQLDAGRCRACRPPRPSAARPRGCPAARRSRAASWRASCS